MGCGKSKEAVATENTITLKKIKKGANVNQIKHEEIKEINTHNEEYFSPRRNDDDHEIESESSEYFSPKIGSGKVIFFTDSIKLLGEDNSNDSQEIFIDPGKENGEVKRFQYLKDIEGSLKERNQE
ncbi:hypothetical protein M5689_005565 [Euphorbia peplus]|nr:hypothetical protein M5689_005565 [Euphorbia peplus]